MYSMGFPPRNSVVVVTVNNRIKPIRYQSDRNYDMTRGSIRRTSMSVAVAVAFTAIVFDFAVVAVNDNIDIDAAAAIPIRMLVSPLSFWLPYSPSPSFSFCRTRILFPINILYRDT